MNRDKAISRIVRLQLMLLVAYQELTPRHCLSDSVRARQSISRLDVTMPNNSLMSQDRYVGKTKFLQFNAMFLRFYSVSQEHQLAGSSKATEDRQQNSHLKVKGRQSSRNDNCHSRSIPVKDLERSMRAS
jgi:hypothetical protein